MKEGWGGSERWGRIGFCLCWGGVHTRGKSKRHRVRFCPSGFTLEVKKMKSSHFSASLLPLSPLLPQVVQIALQLAEAECGKKKSEKRLLSGSMSSYATSSSPSDEDHKSTQAGGGDVAEHGDATSASDRWHFTLLQPSPAHVAAVCVERGSPPG